MAKLQENGGSTQTNLTLDMHGIILLLQAELSSLALVERKARAVEERQVADEQWKEKIEAQEFAKIPKEAPKVEVSTALLKIITN